MLVATPGCAVHRRHPAAGIDFQHEASPTSNKYLVETMGGGVALLDYDNDGRLDIFFTNGAKLDDPHAAGKLPDKSDPEFWNRLYHQNSDGTFTEVTAKAGVSGDAAEPLRHGRRRRRLRQRRLRRPLRHRLRRQHALPQQWQRHLHRCDRRAPASRPAAGAQAPGSSTTTTTASSTSSSPAMSTGAFKTNRYCGEKKPATAPTAIPTTSKAITNILYHNNGDGTFTDVSGKAGIANPSGKGLGVSFADYDGDGFTDIFVANDSVQCFLYHNNGDGTFTEVGPDRWRRLQRGRQDLCRHGRRLRDYDNDGRPDIFVTDLSNERYMLFRNNGDGSFRDVTNASASAAPRLPFSGWSTRFFDYDNDGWKDLFVAQGHVMDTIEKTSPNLRYLQPPLLLRNETGRFAKGRRPARPSEANGLAAARPSATSTTTETSTSWSATSVRAYHAPQQRR